MIFHACSSKNVFDLCTAFLLAVDYRFATKTSLQTYYGLLLIRSHISYIFGLLAINNKKMDFGKRLRAVREKKGMTQENIAEKLKLSQNAYHKIESGATKSLRIDTFKQLADILEVSLSDLMMDEQEKIRFNQTNSNVNNVNTASSMSINNPGFEDEKKVWQELDKSRRETIESQRLLIDSQRLLIERLSR